MAKDFFGRTSYGWLIWNPSTRESVQLTDEYARVFARAVLGEYAAHEHMHRMQQGIFCPLSHEAVAAMEAG